MTDDLGEIEGFSSDATGLHNGLKLTPVGK